MRPASVLLLGSTMHIHVYTSLLPPMSCVIYVHIMAAYGLMVWHSVQARTDACRTACPTAALARGPFVKGKVEEEKRWRLGTLARSRQTLSTFATSGVTLPTISLCDIIWYFIRRFNVPCIEDSLATTHLLESRQGERSLQSR